MESIQQIVTQLHNERKDWVTRFAPSPTGYLHLGHVYAAKWLWTVGRRVSAKILLRIEDHDQGRSRPEYIDAIFSDLRWLGFNPDEVCPLQSERFGRYEFFLGVLKNKGVLYRCRCSRSEIKARSTNQESGELVYDGHCRDKGFDLDGPGSLRLKVDEKTYVFEDLLAKRISQKPSQQCGDFVLQDREGQYSYHFSSVVDDADQGVNLIIRGQDILPSTGRQMHLQGLLGFAATLNYLHHPLLTDENGEKLSKRQLSESISQMRQQGVSKEAILAKVGDLEA